ncbi:MAG: RNA polymerase sigma factor [Planctomycetota bacterium]
MPEQPEIRDHIELARAAREGDRGAFEALIERTHRLVYKIAWQKANHAGDAEDIVQDVFLHAWRSIPRLRDPQACLGWLLAITHNRANRFCRRRRNKIIAFEEARRELEARAAATKPEEDPSSWVAEAVRSLPDELRLALTWKYMEGCSYEEIGGRLGMSFHQVDYLLRRAKRALRRELERGGHEQRR